LKIYSTRLLLMGDKRVRRCEKIFMQARNILTNLSPGPARKARHVLQLCLACCRITRDMAFGAVLTVVLIDCNKIVRT